MAYTPGGVDTTASVSIAANATSSGSCTVTGSAASVTVQLTGTWSATVQIQITRDGTNWVNVTGSYSVTNAATGAYVSAGGITATGVYHADVSGVSGVRVITTAYTSGTVTGTVAVSQGTASMVAIEGNPVVVVSSATPATPSASVVLSTASTNATSVKVTAGNAYAVVLSNPGATAAYFKLYNKASAPTVGTDVPVITIPVPATSTIAYEFGAVGLRFTTGVAFALTGAITDADTTSSAAGIHVFLSYL